MTPERSSGILASIDLGSHTARLLIALWEAGRPKSLLRKRAYIRLAEDFEFPQGGTLNRMGRLPVAERAALPGLDQGRTDVILAGFLVVMEVLNFFHSSEMMVSLTDLLEGALLDMMGVSLKR